MKSRSMRLRLWGGALVAAMAIVGNGGAASRTGSGELVFSCGKGFANICMIDGSGERQLTTDGSPVFAKRYNSPSLSRDGKWLAYAIGYDLYVKNRVTGKTGPRITNKAMLVRISPDGKKVGDIELYPSVMTSGGLVPTVCVFNRNGSGHDSGRFCPGASASFGFTNDGGVLATVTGKLDPKTGRYERAICLLDMASTGCKLVVAEQLGYDLSDPALSPDERLLAVTRAPVGGTQGAIVLFAAGTGQLIRTLTSGTTDSHPVWSPDGTRLAFVRNANTASATIFIVPAGGGRAQALTRGRDASWGE